MIIDFKDLLLRYYRSIEFDIPMVTDVVDNGATEINRVVETILITSAAVKATVEAGLDPMGFSIMNRQEYKHGGILFFTAADEDWEYQLAGSISQTDFEGSYQEGCIKPVEADPNPSVDVMRKTAGADHWEIWTEDKWISNGPPVGFLERMNEEVIHSEENREN